MKLLKHTYTFERRSPQTELVTLHINDGNARTGRFIRVQLQKRNEFPQQIQNLIKLLFSAQDTVTSNKLVKKCVRIDMALYQALSREVGFNESYISATVSKAILDKIGSRVIDVIRTRSFNHRITVRFTQDQYKLVRQTVDELREQGVRGITFSLLVRSILYEHFGIVTEIKKEANSNVA